ncbi:hypothetical protein ACFO4E_05875 [Nocardiopsis mangrovi]|uniref:Uncharacterized protein n=1 Tax=Nocardiopsis mangrovi TaxID=1179818 RepID=A0ABV9DTR5_9ACTN
MSSSESSVPASRGRRRKTDDADAIEGLAVPPSRGRGGRRRKGGTGGAKGGKDAGDGTRSKGRRRALPILLTVLGLGVVALVVVLVMRFTSGGAAAPENARPVVYGIYDSASIGESLPDAQADSRPLAEGEMFERGNEEIESQGITFTLAASELSEDCAAAVWGDELRTALADAGCAQVARGAYTADDYVGVAAMFNLADTASSQALAEAMQPPGSLEAEAPGFVVPPSTEAPFDTLGGGYSQAEATVSGHYLMVTWVQRLESTDPAERERLTSPLIALGGFQDPLYRRVVQVQNSQQGGAGTQDPGTQQGDGTGGTGTGTGTGQEGTGETGAGGTGTDGLGTDGGTGAGDPAGVPAG